MFLQRRRSNLKLDSLENRVCPAIVVRSIGPDLFITGSPVAENGTNQQFLVQQTAPNRFTIQDKAATTRTFGPFSVSRLLSINLNYYNTDINVDINGTFGGNVLLNLGLGDRDLSLTDQNPVSVYSTAAGGKLGGNLTFLRGSGSEIFQVGVFGNPGATTAGALAIGGNLTAVGRNVRGNAAFNNGGDGLFVGPGSSVGGNVSASFIDSVDIGQPVPSDLTTIGGSLTVTNATSPNFLNVNIFGTVNGNVSVTGTVLGDQFVLDQTLAATGGIINGNLSLNLGLASDIGEFVILGTNTVVRNSVSITALGGGGNSGAYTISGAIDGSLRISMGEGDNILAYTGSVTGDVYVWSGNGANDLSTFTGTVPGNIFIKLGNGQNRTNIATAPDGMLIYRGGNGSQSGTAGQEELTLSGADMLYKVDVLFGLFGNHTLVMDSTGNASFITGRLWSGVLATSIFDNQDGIILQPFKINF
ncbi:MAG: hypothetical protein EBV06_05935 [Planctomycetia bacterium]|nr:hypothetical protein [Planctomycetia bacterium]